MITWAGFLGELFQFSIEKIAAKQVSLAPDKKKNASWAFFQLHRWLAELEDGCELFVRIARPVAQGAKTRLYDYRLRELAANMDAISGEFLSMMRRLQLVFRMYDPALAVLIGHYTSSESLFHSAISLSNVFVRAKFSVEWVKTPDGRVLTSSGLLYSQPSRKLTEVNWEDLYSKVSTAIVDHGVGSRPHTEWPTDCLSHLFRSRVVTRFVSPTDTERIRLIMILTEAQVGTVRSTLDQLRVFIARNFTTDDLLYVSRTQR